MPSPKPTSTKTTTIKPAPSKNSTSAKTPLLAPTSTPQVPEMSWTIWLNLIFGLLELVGGIFTNSVMLMTDAVHDLGDSLALVMARMFDRDAERGRTKTFTYGYRRLALFSAFVSSMILLVAAAIMTPYALQRLFHPEMVNIIPVIWLAIIGCIVHAVAILQFRRGRAEEKKLAFYNLVEDLVGWLAVLATALVILIFNIPILDPIMALIMIVFILVTSMRNFYVVLLTFLQAVPANVNVDKLTEKVLGVAYVNDVVDFHVWTLDGVENVGTMLIKINKDLSWRRRNELKKKIREILRTEKINYATLELDETSGEVEEERF